MKEFEMFTYDEALEIMGRMMLSTYLKIELIGRNKFDLMKNLNSAPDNSVAFIRLI